MAADLRRQRQQFLHVDAAMEHDAPSRFAR